MEDKLAALAREIERQNAAFDDARNTLDACGDVELPMPNELLEELDALTSPPCPTGAFALGGLRA